MNGYPPYPRQPFPQNNGTTIMDMGDGIAPFDMGDGQSLDDIVSQNDKARRRSMPVYGGPAMAIGSPDSRRFSTMNFGDPTNTAMGDFQFDLSVGPAMDGIMRSDTFPRTTAELQNDHIPATDLAINTQFANGDASFSNMPSASSYASPLHANAPLDMDITSPYPNPMSMPLEMNDSLNMMASDMNLFPDTRFASSMMDSPVNRDFRGPLPEAPQDPNMSLQPPDQYRSASSSTTPEVRSGIPTRAGSQDTNTMRSNSRPQSEKHTSGTAPTQMAVASLKGQDAAVPQNGQNGQNGSPDNFSQMKFPWTTPPGGFPSTMHSNPHMNTQFKNVYSATGFDMLGVLVCQLRRKHP